jgi:hypothetical protein
MVFGVVTFTCKVLVEELYLSNIILLNIICTSNAVIVSLFGGFFTIPIVKLKNPDLSVPNPLITVSFLVEVL